jgi:uncharacterized protein YciI
MGSLFVMIAKDGPDGARLRKEVRSEHLAHLDALVKAGKIAIAGPFTDGTGSLIVFEADSIEAAQAQAASDPYVTRGVFESYEVKPFKRVLP